MSSSALTSTRRSYGFVHRYQLELRMFAVLALLSIALSSLSSHFFSLGNLFNLMDQSVVVGIVAIGQTFVILVSGIDLSVGAMTGVAGMVLGLTLTSLGLPLPVAIVCALAVGTLMGLMNGILVSFGRVAPFIVTLGMMSIGRSIAYVLSDGTSVSSLPSELAYIGSADIFGVPLNFVLLVALFAVAWYYLNYTKGGRTIYAIGSNVDAARASGLNVSWYTNLAYVISGALSAVAAVLLSSRLMSIDPVGGTGLELDAIAAVVIGGASLFGGRGSMIGTFFGVIIMALIRNGLNLLNVGPYWQGSAIGAIIIIAVLAERIATTRLNKSR
ncbi:ABC transporter permease [Glaciimonas sp. PCH181]|uniref:ABC transporter permease n=1 Tax=Glaciimonas sp. PCH181 TaxID=2133943 RepID=UPI000D35E8A6|nr:ABC transporter permease [Glaciimonas sp. PCH181]PUA19710.1 ABC transporter permease [Glaciimonas sp. PCH181]